MLDSQVLNRLAASPAAQATLILLVVALVVQWYFSLPPSPKFPKAELDETDWHGSLMKAKSKVRRLHGHNTDFATPSRPTAIFLKLEKEIYQTHSSIANTVII